MKQITNILGIIILFLSIYGCSEYKLNYEHTPRYLDQMPEETSIGANAFGCSINGNVAASQGNYQETWPSQYVNGHLSRTTDNWIRINDTTWLYKDTTYTHMQFRFDSKHYYIKIEIPKEPTLGINNCEYYIYCDTSKLKMNFKHSVNITTFNEYKQIISGRFDNIELDDEGRLIHITKGRFDVKYSKNF